MTSLTAKRNGDGVDNTVVIMPYESHKEYFFILKIT